MRFSPDSGKEGTAMIHRKTLTEDQARQAMQNGELGSDVRTSSRYVAVILTQDWCPQWPAMQRWMASLQQKGKPEDVNIDVYDLEYNRISFADQFMRFKENVLGNQLIPYVRYYIDGELVAETNFVMRDAFFKAFGLPSSRISDEGATSRP